MASMNKIGLYDISRYRSELMGLAMVLIILFHVRLPQSDFFFGLKRCGSVGVDMFMFLSGVGLWFSWTRTPSLKYWETLVLTINVVLTIIVTIPLSFFYINLFYI